MLRTIINGMKSSEEYGSHPGNIPMIVFVVLGSIAGLDGGLLKALLGAVIMLCVFGPLYLISAYERGKDAIGSK